jgi:Fic/DOC family
MSSTLLGFQRLAQMHGITLVQQLRTRSQVGPSRQRTVVDGQELQTWPSRYQPPDSFRGHFEFGLKHEQLNLEFLSRLFARLPAAEVAAWLAEEPTGGYARRAAFFYEWLTGQPLDAPDTAANVGYVDAIDSAQYLAAQRPDRVRRWRVNNNLPGVRNFCPMVYLGRKDERDWLYNVADGVRQLDDAYGPELLLRSAAWLTFKESRASFAIEHEGDQQDRVRRFAAAIGEFSGRMEQPLQNEGLNTLQKAVLGEHALRLGIRRSPVFVGQSTFLAQVVHYIAPTEAFVDPMLSALAQMEERTRGADPVVRAAAVAFAFVYLHPLVDGNGRIHRFLINHLLAADQAVPTNIVVPVSATIAGTARGRADYDQVLEVFSRPFMQAHAGDYRFGTQRTCPDGVVTNFEFTATDEAQHAWRFIDLTEHARYLSGVLRQTVENEMAQEAQALGRNDAARVAIKQVLELPNDEADLIIRSLSQSAWTVSNKLRKALPEIFDEAGTHHALHAQILAGVREALEGGNSGIE